MPARERQGHKQCSTRLLAFIQAWQCLLRPVNTALPLLKMPVTPIQDTRSDASRGLADAPSANLLRVGHHILECCRYEARTSSHCSAEEDQSVGSYDEYSLLVTH